MIKSYKGGGEQFERGFEGEGAPRSHDWLDVGPWAPKVLLQGGSLWGQGVWDEKELEHYEGEVV